MIRMGSGGQWANGLNKDAPFAGMLPPSDAVSGVGIPRFLSDETLQEVRNESVPCSFPPIRYANCARTNRMMPNISMPSSTRVLMA